MRESKTIRRTFPGTVDSPGTKEQIMTIALKPNSLDKRSEGLGGAVKQEDDSVNPDRGHSQAGEEDLRRAGQHCGNETSGCAALPSPVSMFRPAPPMRLQWLARRILKPRKRPQPAASEASASDKPGSIDPFRQMVRDLNK